MTDTEILDYLERAYAGFRMPQDAMIGRCHFTLGLKDDKRTFREILMQSIQADKAATVLRITHAIEDS